MAMFRADDADSSNELWQMFGPGQVDQQIRQAIHMCWMMLPKDRKTVDESEKQLRRLFDRAIKDLRDDADAFGLEK